MAVYMKLSDIREMLAAALERPVSRQLAHKYSARSDFPAAAMERPLRLWQASAVYDWMTVVYHDSAISRPQRQTKDNSRSRLWRWIKQHGGIKRNVLDYWDPALSTKENRARHCYLDRAWGKGRGMDDLAGEIATVYPEYYIADADDLWVWLGQGDIN